MINLKNINLLKLAGAIKSKNTKQALVSLIPKQYMQNPMVSNVVDMFQKSDYAGIEDFARNICKERGMDADELFNDISTLFKN